MLRNRLLCLLSLLLLAAPALAQQKTKEQLQKERAENLRKIKEAEATLKQTSSKKKASVGQLNAINYQIKTRQKVINSLAEEINLLNQDIAENQEIINALNEDLEALKKEYAAMVYAAYKASNSRDKLMFLFAAESFNQLLRRLDYLKQYSKARKTQVEQIQAVQQMLLSEIETIEKKKQEKNQLLAEQLAAKKDLEKMRQKQRTILASLQQQEKKLKKELAQRRKSLKALDKLINDLIRREAEAAAKAAALAKNKAAAALSADFSKNKRQLPWPAEGFISLKFGRSRDPVLKMVERDSPGIEIQTKPGAIARSVFSGEVRAVALIQGFNKAVIIKHGNYFTVYAKLAEVYVKKGQQVKTGDKVGKVYTDDDGIAELHFELWETQEKGTVKLNPELWLQKK